MDLKSIWNFRKNCVAFLENLNFTDQASNELRDLVKFRISALASKMVKDERTLLH